jgi:hypothetical protein
MIHDAERLETQASRRLAWLGSTVDRRDSIGDGKQQSATMSFQREDEGTG